MTELNSDPNLTQPVPHDMAEIVESDRDGFIALSNDSWNPDNLEYLPFSELPTGLNELEVGTWVSIYSHRKASDQSLVSIQSFEKIDPPHFSAEERDEFWNQRSMRSDQKQE